jgi:hypothetical protein
MKTSHNWLNLIRLWINYNNKRVTISLNKIYKQQRRSKFAFAVLVVGPSMAFFINKKFAFHHGMPRNNIDVQ